MTPRMAQFLRRASCCEPGTGWPPDIRDRRIAGKAVSDGYGMMMGITGFMLFIISDAGRRAVALHDSALDPIPRTVER